MIFQKDKSSVQLYRWRNCHLTQEVLRPPIVACGMGLLYNKESVLQYLVNKTPFPEASAHIKNLKVCMSPYQLLNIINYVITHYIYYII